jgi:hypothetical protein
VAQDQQGLRGGRFLIVRKRLFENGNRPQAVIIVPDVLELDMSRSTRAASHPVSNTRLSAA